MSKKFFRHLFQLGFFVSFPNEYYKIKKKDFLINATKSVFFFIFTNLPHLNIKVVLLVVVYNLARTFSLALLLLNTTDGQALNNYAVYTLGLNAFVRYI